MEAISGKRILVTGASGFIGSHLCRRLARVGTELHAVSRMSEGAPDIARWWRGDLKDAAFVDELVRSVRPEIVFHLAGSAKGSRELDLVKPLFESHVVGTVNLLTSSAQAGVGRIIMPGSMEEPDTGSVATPNSPYAAAKFASSVYGRLFHALFKLPVVNLRLFMVYGPEQREAWKLIPHIILSLLKGEAPRLSSGSREIDWVFVEDAVGALVAAATAATEAEGKTIDVGSGRLTSIKDLADRLADMINPEIRPVFGSLGERPMEQVRQAKTSEASRILGWEASTQLEVGLRKTVNWFSNSLKMSDLRVQRY